METLLRTRRALLCAGLLLAPCALSGQQSSPAPTSVPAADAEVAATVAALEADPALRDSLVAVARRQLGRRYLFGGTDPVRGFDCSGFTRYLMRALGVQIPRTAAQQARAGVEVARDPSQLRVGDVLTFGKNGRVTHVGVYIGGGQYVHASSGAGRVVVSRLDRPQSRLVRAWYGVRRYLSAPGDTAQVRLAGRPAEPEGS